MVSFGYLGSPGMDSTVSQTPVVVSRISTVLMYSLAEEPYVLPPAMMM